MRWARRKERGVGPKQAKDFSDHDLLIRIDQRTDTLEKGFSNHLTSHFRINLMAWAAALAAITALIIVVLS